jgi:hypothetical protein
MADWATISSLATAGGTLVLAVATFSSHEGGQRTITRFLLAPWPDVDGRHVDGKRVSALRYWYLDREDPR